MDARLVLQTGKKRQSIPLRQRGTVIGRRQGATLRIPSAEVSRQHCRILMADEGYLIVEDLGSANGTFVNDAPVTGREVLRPGDQLRVGPATFVVEYQLTQRAIDRLLEGIPDEEVIAAEPASDELPQAQVLDEDEPTGEAPAEEAPAGFDLVDEVDSSAEALAALDDVEAWSPAEQDYRDLLTNLEEPEEPPRKRKRS